jgi:hypothetical protein
MGSPDELAPPYCPLLPHLRCYPRSVHHDGLSRIGLPYGRPPSPKGQVFLSRLEGCVAPLSSERRLAPAFGPLDGRLKLPSNKEVRLHIQMEVLLLGTRVGGTAAGKRVEWDVLGLEPMPARREARSPLFLLGLSMLPVWKDDVNKRLATIYARRRHLVCS